MSLFNLILAIYKKELNEKTNHNPESFENKSITYNF